MLELIKDRISVICALVIGTSGGFGMTAFITSPEIKPRLVAIALAVSLALSLLISVSLKKKLPPSDANKRKARRILTMMLVGFVLSAGVFFIVYDKFTMPIPVFVNPAKFDTLIIVKGLYYTAPAKKYAEKLFQKNHIQPTDDILLNDYGYDVSKVWNDDSRSYARLLLLFLYATMIALLVAFVTYASEKWQQWQPAAKPGSKGDTT